MTKDRLARIMYAAAVGGLCGSLITPIWLSLVVGLGIILFVCVVSEVFGE